MSLFVPILRLCLLFFNIYGSYKTLKPPRPSSRSRTGLPSQTALMQRKRDLKGCMTVWIVWCCMAVYERHVERIISLFIPFYDEFKAMALLFLIVTRAKGAEPIFLHAIRPFLKPYTSTIDSILDLCRMVGDIIFALLGFCTRSAGDLFKNAYQALPSSIQVPFSYIGSLLPVLPALHHSHTTTTAPSGDVTFSQAPQFTGVPHYPQSYSTPHSTIEGLPHDDPDSFFSPPTRGQPIIDDPNSLFTPPGMVQPVELPSLQSLIYANPNAPPRPSNAPVPGADAWNWDWDSRQYPSFPSAYPPTPLTNNSNLPAKGRRLAKDPWRDTDGAIAEEEEDNHPHHQHPHPGNGQGFHQSLLPPRKPLNPGFDKRDKSDENLRGVNQSKTRYMEVEGGEESSESDMGDVERDRTILAGIGMNETEADEADDSMDMDSGVDSDGSFNVTLSTPRAPLEPSGSAASIMTLRSTMRTRASARSLFVSYPAPVSADADIEEESERSGRSSRSSSQSRVGLTSTNDERTMSSGSTSEESLVLGAVSVSSLEAAIGTDAEPNEVRVGQKRRLQRTASPDRDRPEDSSRKFATIRQTRRTGRSARTRGVPEGDRLTTEDEGSSSWSCSRQRQTMATRSRVAVKQPKPDLPRGTSSSTLPVRKRRKVDDVGSRTTDSLKPMATKETDPPAIKPGDKTSTRPHLRPKRPLASSKSSISTITNTRATSRLRASNLKEESSESSSQP